MAHHWERRNIYNLRTHRCPFQHLKEENKELKIKNEKLNRELGRLEGQITEMKKMSVRQDASAGCADASGSGLTIMK